MASITKRPNGKYRVRWRDHDKREHARDFDLWRDARDERSRVEQALKDGTFTDPALRKMTVAAWCDKWFDGYVGRESTRRQARTHLVIIKRDFGGRRLGSVKPTDVRAWIRDLQDEGRAPSYVYALHSRLRQIMQDAVHDGLIAVNPCSRRTAPPMGRQRPYVASSEQVWALYDAMPVNVRGAVLLGAYAGLRVAETAALRRSDVNWLRGVVSPVQQWPEEPLKTDESLADIPVPRELCEMIAKDMLPEQTHVLRNDWERPCAPWVIERAFRSAVESIANDEERTVEPLPDGFRYHDLRHHYASLLIHSGLSVKEVQARLRHGSAKTTLDVYAHLWPDTEDAARSAVKKVLADRAKREDNLRTSGK